MIKSILIIIIFLSLGWSQAGIAQSIPSTGGSKSLLYLRPNNISDGEIQLSAIESQILKYHQEHNALQNRLNSRLHQADSLKTSGASENILAKFTAASFLISQKLESLNHLLKDLETKHGRLRVDLYQFYTQKIDSLSGLTKSIQTDRDLFVLMGKRLHVSPLAGKLHFNPQQLSAIDETESDSLAQIIFAQYLQKADTELGKEIEALQNKEQEIQELAALESKAEEFMQEMEESSMLQTVSTTDAKSTENSFIDYGSGDESVRNLVTANEQALSFFHLLNQWQTNPSQRSPGSQPLAYPQLLQKLGETRQVLESYRRQVLNKLELLSDR